MTDGDPPVATGRSYAVTGAAGFVGRNLVRTLREDGCSVTAVLRTPQAAAELESMGATVRYADVTDPDALAAAFAGVDGVFHLAALFNDPDKSWDDYRAVNVAGTENVVRAAKRAGAGRVVHCSTVGVATEAHPPPYRESTPYSPQPDDKYEVTKAEGEQSAIRVAAEEGVDLAVIRPAQVYGPGDRSKAKFYKLVRKGVIVNPGRTLKHLIYIDDLCKAFLLAMERESAVGEVFLIAGREATPLTRLVAVAADAMGVPSPRWKLPAGPVVFASAAVEKLSNVVGIKPPIFKRSMDFFVRSVECDTTKARDVLRFEAETGVEEGVGATVGWLRSEGLIAADPGS